MKSTRCRADFRPVPQFSKEMISEGGVFGTSVIESLFAVRGVGSNHCRRKAAALALMSVYKGGGDQTRQHFLATLAAWHQVTNL